jgi:DNA-binding NarL/FixJ family response regulator
VGYVSKSSERSTLLKAIKSVLEGKTYFSESARRGVDNARSVAHHANLSVQVFKILLGIAAGRRTGQIAAESNLSAKTVSTYKHRVLNKLGLTSTPDLVRYVIAHKLA